MVILGGIFEDNKIKNKIESLNTKILEPNFWKNQVSAQKIQKEKSYLEDISNSFNSLSKEFETIKDLLLFLMDVSIILMS